MKIGSELHFDKRERNFIEKIFINNEFLLYLTTEIRHSLFSQNWQIKSEISFGLDLHGTSKRLRVETLIFFTIFKGCIDKKNS